MELAQRDVGGTLTATVTWSAVEARVEVRQETPVTRRVVEELQAYAASGEGHSARWVLRRLHRLHLHGASVRLRWCWESWRSWTWGAVLVWTIARFHFLVNPGGNDCDCWTGRDSS